jgi:RNA polymerase sigma factor (sigma-70 family)
MDAAQCRVRVMKFGGTPTKVTAHTNIFLHDKPSCITENAKMPQPSFHPSSGLNLQKESAELATPGCQAESPARRADGTLDWSNAMARAQAGDQKAYRRLLEDITPYLRALAARNVRNGADIEDAVQDVLLTIHAVRNTYDPSLPFGPWLVAIANRRITDGLRRRGRIGSHETSLEPEHVTFIAADANLQEEMVDARMVREAVERLTVVQRDAVRMLKLEEMSLDEAATASGMSVAALKVATHRAMKRLRKMFNQGDDKK